MEILCPVRCPLCGRFSRHSLCAECLAAVLAQPQPRARCRECDRELPTEAGGHCGQCGTGVFPFAGNRSAFRFRFPLTRLVHLIKFGADLDLCRTLAGVWASRLGFPPCGTGCVTAVPLSRMRRLSRGFNQAAVLAAALAAAWGLPYRELLCRRRRTSRQARLGARDRRRNLQGAFALREPVGFTGGGVVLVDDVFTTGATVAAASRALLDAGAPWVVVRTLAHG